MVKFWEKLGIGLKKSSDLLSAGLADIFTKKKLDQDTLNELEDLLISSDFGISTSTTLIAELAAKKMLNNQIAKCTTSGVITGLGGVLTLPVTIPANVSSILYMYIRMIACTATLAGNDLTTDKTRALVYACLAGVSAESLQKRATKAGDVPRIITSDFKGAIDHGTDSRCGRDLRQNDKRA